MLEVLRFRLLFVIIFLFTFIFVFEFFHVFLHIGRCSKEINALLEMVISFVCLSKHRAIDVFRFIIIKPSCEDMASFEAQILVHLVHHALVAQRSVCVEAEAVYVFVLHLLFLHLVALFELLVYYFFLKLDGLFYLFLGNGVLFGEVLMGD